MASLDPRTKSTDSLLHFFDRVILGYVKLMSTQSKLDFDSGEFHEARII